MFNKPFWIFLLASFILAAYSFRIRKFKFTDIQIIFMVIAVCMSLDMILCKQFNLYTYVDTDYRGWYSFLANLIIAPSLAIIFIKFVPAGRGKIILYIISWSICCTLMELFILKPAEIVYYHGWKPFPHSLFGYIAVLSWEYVYFKILEKHTIENGH